MTAQSGSYLPFDSLSEYRDAAENIDERASNILCCELGRRLLLGVEYQGEGFKVLIRQLAYACDNICESPIEEQFIAAVVASFATSDMTIVLGPDEGIPDCDGLAVMPQWPIGDFRVDFLLQYQTNGNAKFMVVECDGHEFHEKTKEQASRDKRRDRELQRAGFIVYRYPGSDVYADPLACAQEAVIDLYEACHKARQEKAVA